jgi:hypothetical protein
MASTSKQVIKELELQLGVDVNSFIDRVSKRIIATTPVKTGRARAGWTKVDSYKPDGRTRTVIINKVPYIGVLDDNKGIVEPAIDDAAK